MTAARLWSSRDHSGGGACCNGLPACRSSDAARIGPRTRAPCSRVTRIAVARRAPRAPLRGSAKRPLAAAPRHRVALLVAARRWCSEHGARHSRRGRSRHRPTESQRRTISHRAPAAPRRRRAGSPVPPAAAPASTSSAGAGRAAAAGDRSGRTSASARADQCQPAPCTTACGVQTRSIWRAAQLRCRRVFDLGAPA